MYRIVNANQPGLGLPHACATIQLYVAIVATFGRHLPSGRLHLEVTQQSLVLHHRAAGLTRDRWRGGEGEKSGVEGGGEVRLGGEGDIVCLHCDPQKACGSDICILA